LISWPSEVYNLETGEIFPVFDILEFPDGFDIVVKVGRKYIVAYSDEWEFLTIDYKSYVYSIAKKKMELKILRTKYA
jgi:hypothetical protein